MFERFMRWLGYVPACRYADAMAQVKMYRVAFEDERIQVHKLMQTSVERAHHLGKLRQYAHVKQIERNIEQGRARKK